METGNAGEMPEISGLDKRLVQSGTCGKTGHMLLYPKDRPDAYNLVRPLHVSALFVMGPEPEDLHHPFFHAVGKGAPDIPPRRQPP